MKLIITNQQYKKYVIKKVFIQINNYIINLLLSIDNLNYQY